jgi:hypothetical protein
LPPTELAEAICVFLYGGEILQLGDIFFQEMKKKKKNLKTFLIFTDLFSIFPNKNN